MIKLNKKSIHWNKIVIKKLKLKSLNLFFPLQSFFKYFSSNKLCEVWIKKVFKNQHFNWNEFIQQVEKSWWNWFWAKKCYFQKTRFKVGSENCSSMKWRLHNSLAQVARNRFFAIEASSQLEFAIRRVWNKRELFDRHNELFDMEKIKFNQFAAVYLG